MHTYTDKTQENKRQSVANRGKTVHTSAFKFADNRPVSFASSQPRARPDIHVAPVQEKQESVHSTTHVVQKQNIGQAGLLPAYAQGANTPLYNIPGGVNLPQGYLYTHTLAPVPAAAGTAGVLDSYITATRGIGQALTGRQFLDKNSEPPNLPSVVNWAANSAVFLTSLEQWAESPLGSFAGMLRPAALILRNDLAKANRLNSRNAANIGLIDPFVAELTIQQIGQAQPWIIQTDFSTSALGYITDIQVGTNNVRGHLAATPGAFAAVAANNPAIGGFAYSPAHDVADTNTVEHQIGTIAAGATNAGNHPGLDAITKLGAEGARFEPVRQLGTSLRINSLFYTVKPSGQIVCLNFRELYQNWGTWFGRGYGINSASIKAQVLLHGSVMSNAVHRANDYDLDSGGPAATFTGAYTADITHYVNQIDHLRQAKINYARGKGPKQQAAVAAYNRGKNQQIDQIERDLRPYKILYPDLYHAVKFPPPPPVAIVPAAAPAAVGAAAVAPADNNYRKIIMAGVFLTLVAANEIYNYLHGQAGLFYDWGKDK